MLRRCTTSRCWLAALSSTSSPSTVQLRRQTSTMSSLPTPPDPIRHGTQKMGSTTAERVGQSGCRYLIQRVLQEKELPPPHVYLATARNQQFILKDVSQSDFKYYQEMHRNLRSCPFLRVLQDTIPEHSIFVFQYFTDDLLSLAQEDLPIAVTKRILKDTLRGLTALHDHNIVHTDVKANNIVVERVDDANGMAIEQVQLADIEDAAYVPSGCAIVGKQVGNYMWRSPEAHAQGRVNKPSDIFSFGVVCIYAVLRRVIFAVGEEELGDGEEVLAVVLERQISCLADEDGLNGLLKHLGDSPWCEVLEVIRDDFNETNPRKPFSLWKNVDADFKDLICGMTNFDPAKRLTAHEALAHGWFGDV